MGSPTAQRFSDLREFIAFSESASSGLSPAEIFGGADGSYLSLLVKERRQNSRAVLLFVRSLRDAAVQLVSVLEEGLDISHQKLIPAIHGEGISSLPLEIMERIVLFAYSPSDKSWRNLLLVNRHFRYMTRNIPHLWTVVEVGSNPQPYLERSGSRGLAVSLGNVSKYKGNLQRWLSAVDPSLERWTSFSVEAGPDLMGIDNPRSKVHHQLLLLRNSYKGRTFPVLEALRVRCMYDTRLLHAMRSPERDPRSSVRSFFSTWNMPALRKLETYGFVPVLPGPCLRSITHLRLELGDPCNDGPLHSIRVIIGLLRSLSSLEQLFLTLANINKFLERNNVQKVELQHLRALTIKVLGGRSSTWDALFKVFLVPNLRELSLIAHVDDDVLADSLTDIFFPDKTPRFEHLEKLNYEVSYAENHKEACPLETLFCRLPHVQELTVSGWKFHWPEDFWLHRYLSPSIHRPARPSLRSLRFIGCDQLATSFVFEHLASIICAPEFEALEIHRCRNVDTGAIRKAVPEGKVFRSTEYDWTDQISHFGNPRWASGARVDYGSDDDIDME